MSAPARLVKRAVVTCRTNLSRTFLRSAALLAAAVCGCVVGAFITRHRHGRELAIALADANHDPLTGLPNRRAAVVEVSHRLTGTHPFLLALLDLDDFKTVNDTYGHPTGDDLLIIVAMRLHIAVSPDGFIARLGGDEFLLLLPEHGGDPADTVVPMLALLSQPVHIGEVTLRPSACIGVASTTSGATSWRTLIARADQALYRAKTNDDGVAVYDPHLDNPEADSGQQRHHTRRRDHRPHRPADLPATEPDT